MSEVARLLGISRNAVYQGIKAGKFRVVGRPRRWRIPAEELGLPAEVLAGAAWLSVNQAAGLLRLGRDTVIKLIKEGELPAERRGGRYLISRAAVEAYLSSGMNRGGHDR